ncbi:MAG: aspartate 1-decarboxylase [Hydrogenothermaceae bacterium]|nr:aspartate 1-decarboxylase [Hydrogenothermaceae bacterium]
MYRTMLKSKVHRIRITGADLHYEGSLTLDEAIMEAANLVPFEKIEVYNINNGQRFSTYVIPGIRYGGECILNGAAARLGHYGDIIIIASYAHVEDRELKNYKIDLVYIDENTNSIKEHKQVDAITSKVSALEDER